MTDQELDDLEARLRVAHLEYCEGVAVGYGYPINPDGPEAADAIAELRVKNAELRGDIEAIRCNSEPNTLGCYCDLPEETEPHTREQHLERQILAINSYAHAALEDKENTQ